MPGHTSGAAGLAMRNDGAAHVSRVFHLTLLAWSPAFTRRATQRHATEFLSGHGTYAWFHLAGSYAWSI
jgi:hypothetical protein